MGGRQRSKVKMTIRAGCGRYCGTAEVALLDVKSARVVARECWGECAFGALNRPATARQIALQDFRLLDHAREVGERLLIDGRRLRQPGLLDLRQIASVQNC